MMGQPYGLQSMLKEGHKYFSGVDEAVMKNIDACKGLAQITRTSLGPNGACLHVLERSSMPAARERSWCAGSLWSTSARELICRARFSPSQA